MSGYDYKEFMASEQWVVSMFYSSMAVGFHTCAVTPTFLAENFGLGTENPGDAAGSCFKNVGQPVDV